MEEINNIGLNTRVSVMSNKSGQLIKPSVDDVNYGLIVHGNVRAVTSNLTYAGIIGDNFVGKKAHDYAKQNAFTAEEFLDIVNFDVDSIKRHIEKRQLKHNS